MALDLLKNDNILTSLFLLKDIFSCPSITDMPLCVVNSVFHSRKMNRYQSMRMTMLLREVGENNKMFLAQKGNENEEISKSLEADQIHTKLQHN